MLDMALSLGWKRIHFSFDKSVTLKFYPCRYFTEIFLHFVDHEEDNITNFISSYVVSIPDLSVRKFSFVVYFP
jgi:hypothetical protein